MAWLRSLGDFPDLAGTVAKLSESVKNIEKNFDSALGLEEKPDAGEASGIWPSTSDGKALFGPVMAFMGHKGDDTATEVSGNVKSSEKPSSVEEQDKISGEGLHTSTEERAASVYKDEDSENKDKEGSYSTSGTWPSTSDVISLLEPGMVSMENKSSDTAVEVSGNVTSLEQPSQSEQQDQILAEVSHIVTVDKTASVDEHEDIENKERDVGDSHITDTTLDHSGETNKDSPESELNIINTETALSFSNNSQSAESIMPFQHKEGADTEINDESQSGESMLAICVGVDEIESNTSGISGEHVDDSQSHGNDNNMEIEADAFLDEGSRLLTEELDNRQITVEESSDAFPVDTLKHETTHELSYKNTETSSIPWQGQTKISDPVKHNINKSRETQEGSMTKDYETDNKEKHLSTTINSLDSASSTEVEKLRNEIRSMEASMLGAARQAQAKADEIANLMNENEYLRSVIEDLKRKSAEAEIDTLRDEYHQRVSALEKKVYALTKERDTLRREQNRKSDTAALLKEKDEIISQVMSEGEELSKKQAAQESTIRKLRAQIREFEEEKQRIHSKLQVEETKVESIKKDKAATEKLFQETIERNQAELASQKEFYTNAVNAAREAESLAEARANNEARLDLESRLSEAGERESLLVQTLEELRQTLSRTEQKAVFREDMLQRDIEDLQKRYQASELRYNELITQVPESTKPLLRQIEAMQETSNQRAEAWAGVERALNSRLQEAEAKAADAEERERAMNERLSQSISRITVLETQIACLRTEQTQLSRTLEKERQRASENRQEYLAATEEAATQEGRAKQLEDEIKDLRNRSRHDLLEEVSRRELLEKELERERAARLEMEKTASRQTSVVATSPYSENGSISLRKLSNARSLGGIEESLFLQASLDTSETYLSEKRIVGEANMSPYFLKSMTPSAFEAALRQKDGELASYMSRLASLESIRDSLAEELVKMTAQCEKLRTEAAVVPSIQAELEALRRRHSSALELMGERDEELEELRADIMDLKEMYREQVDLLVNRLQTLSSSVGAA